jgi:hypothetical protein
MQKTIRAFLESNNISAITQQVSFVKNIMHPSGTMFSTTLTYHGERATFFTYGGQYPLEGEKDPTFQLEKIHDDLYNRYEETLERFIEENEDYVYWFGRAGAGMLWQEVKEYWDPLHHVLGEDLFQHFYWLDPNSD